MKNPMPDVLISEVGPRDGLQSVKATMPTADKFRWIDALAVSYTHLDVYKRQTLSC